MALGRVKFSLKPRDTEKNSEPLFEAITRFEGNIKGTLRKYDKEAAVKWTYITGLEIFDLECAALNSEEICDLMQQEIEAQGIEDRVLYGPVAESG